MSQAGIISEGPSGTNSIDVLTGNSGGQVGPALVSGKYNINIVGSGNINVVGNPGTNTLTISEGSGSQTVGYTSINHAASPYTVLATDYYISADVTAGVISILLPNAPATGRIFAIKDKVGLSGTSNISVTTVGGAVTIDGVTTYTMNSNYASIQLIFNGTSYEVY